MQTQYLIRIKFPRKELGLEDIIRLIYFNKTDFNFSKDLHSTIIHLRKHSSAIKSIGYDEENIYSICAYLKLNSKDVTKEELDFFESISR